MNKAKSKESQCLEAVQGWTLLGMNRERVEIKTSFLIRDAASDEIQTGLKDKTKMKDEDIQPLHQQ